MNEFDGENQDDAFYQSSGSAYREEVVPRSRGPKPITSRDIVEMFGGSGASLPTPKPAPAPVAQPVARDKPITSQDIVAMFAGSPADEVVEQPKPAKEPGLDISGGLAKGFKGLKVTWDYLANRLEKAVTGDEKDTKDILSKSAEEYGKLQSDPRLAELIRLGDEAPNTAAAVGDMLWYAIKNPTLVANFLAEQVPGAVVGGGVGGVITAPARAAAVGAATRLGASQAVTGFVGKGVTGAGINTGAVTLQSLGSNYVEGLQKYDGDTEAASQYAVTKTAAEVPANAVAGAFLGFAPFASKFANIGTQVAIQGAGGATGAFQAAEAVGEKASRGEMILEFLGEGAFAPVDILLSRFGDKKKSEGDNINDIRNRMNVPEGRKEIWDTLNTDPKIAQIIKDVGLESPADPNFDEVVSKVVDIARVKEAVEQISPKTPEEIREERKARQEEVAAAFRDTASTGVGVGVGTPVEGVIRRESVQVDEQGRQLVPIGEKPDQVLIPNEQGVSTPAVSGEDIVAAQQGFKPLPGTKIGATPWANRFLNARQAQANIDTLETGNELEAKLEAHRKAGNVFDKEALSAARTQLNDLRVRFGLPRITKWKQPIQPIFPDLSAQDVQIRQGKRSKEAGGGDFFFLEARPLPTGAVKPERVQTKTPAPATPAAPAAPASTVGVPGASQTPSGQAPAPAQPGATVSTTPSTTVSTVPTTMPSTMPTTPVSTEATTQPTTTPAAPVATQTEGTNNAAQEGDQQQGDQRQRAGDDAGREAGGRKDRQRKAAKPEARTEDRGGGGAQESRQGTLDLRRVLGDELETVEELNRKAQSLLDPAKGEVFRAVRVPVGNLVGKIPGLGLIQKAASLFGKEVVFFRVEEGKAFFDGAVIRGGKKIFVNVNSTKPHIRIVGHELVHAMRRTNPAAYDRLVNSLQPMLDQKGFASYSELLKSEGMKTADKILEEAIGDIVGDRFGESEFWQMLADRNPTGFKQFAREVINFIDNILKKIGVNTMGSETLVKDLKAARAEIARILADVGQETQAAGEGIDLSRSRPKKRTGDVVSTRAPSAVKATENAIDNLLTVGIDAIRMTPGMLEQHATVLSKYPNLTEKQKSGDAESVIKAFVDHVVENLLWLHDKMPAEIRARAKLWYDGANKIAKRLSKQYDMTEAQAAGVLATQSPQKDWFQNVDLARRIADTYRTKQDFGWSDEMNSISDNKVFPKGAEDGNAEILAAIRGKSLSQLTDTLEKAAWIRVYDEAHNSRSYPIVTPEGDIGAMQTTKTGADRKVAWGGFDSIAKAVSIIEDGSIENISEQLGDAHKVRSFYNNIIDPKSKDGHVTIDTHAVAAALLRPLAGGSTEVKHALGGTNPGVEGPSGSTIFGVSGTYGIFADAYRIAAKKRGILPREMQSITWEAVRGLFPDTFKRGASALTIDQVWYDYQTGNRRTNEVRNEVFKIADGITQPDWVGVPASRLDAAEEDTVDAGELPAAQLPGRGAGVDRRTRGRPASRVQAEVAEQTPPEGGVSVSDISLSRAREAREIARKRGRLFFTDRFLGAENVPGRPQSGRKLRNPVTLKDGTRLNGFTTDEQTVFAGYDKNGERISIRVEYVNPDDVVSSRDSNKTAAAVKEALAGDAPSFSRPIAGQENSGTTQVATTAGSYKKAARAILDAAPDAANVLDYGAGLGIGTDALREVFGDRVTVESYEPFPQRWAGDRPVDYTRSNEIPGKYDAVVNLNVLNVLEPGLRDQVARDIADKLAPGGVAVIGTRKWTGDISTAKNIEKAAEDKAVYVVRRAGGEDVRVYQKGFDGRELVDYLSGLLGDGFTVSQGSGIAANTAIIQRQSADTDISLSRARVAEAVSSASVPGPFAQAVRDRIASAILPSGEQRFNWWHKSIGTQLEKARVNPYFRKVYDLGQKFLDDTAMFAMRAQAAAPTILPNLGNMGIRFWKGGISKANNELLGKMLAEGTLLNGPSPMNGKIWTDAELRSRYNATDEQIKLYREARAAIDQSLDDTTKALMGQLARSGGIPQSAIDPLMEAQLPLSAVRDRLVKALQALPSTGKVQTAINGVKKMASETEAMKKGGYAPLMRFGEFVVSVENAKGDVEYFSLHETAADALRTRNEITKQFKGPGFKVSNPGARLNSARFKMFAGLSPSTLEAFFNAVPVTSKAEENLRQEYLQLVVSNRSALARMIQRKGTAGYTLDATRTLASFITSNARHSSKALNMAEISRAITQIPAEQGDVADEAVKLQEYLQNPQEGVPGIRGFLFFNFLGGSIAAGLVNMTQPVLMTYPYLTQWGAGRASSAMSKAMKDATAHLLKKPTGNKALDAALKKAAERGITQPQEMFQLIAAAESGTSSLLGHKFMRVWGLNFAVSEVFNRVVTFTAAFNIGSTLSQAELQKAGVKDAFEFAVRTVEDTQGKYNKGNRPNWARETGVLGSAGTLMFTFKQYSIAYMEFLKQLYKNDKNGKKALGIALGTLILAAGLSGLPGADDLDDLIDTVGNWMGYPTNSKKWKVKFLTETLGLSTQSANFLLYGVSSFLPMDLQARLGLANLIPGTGLLNPTRDNKAREVLDVIGPLGGFAANAADAVEMTAKGNFRGAGMKLAPKAVKDAYQGFEMATTGVVRDEKGRTIQEATATEALVKGIGFNPQSVASEGRVQRMIQADIDIVKSKKEELHEQMARAIVDRDEDLKDKVLDELSRWNSGDPEYRIKLDTKAIQARVKKMIIDRSQRFAQQAPKDMRARIIRDLQEQKDARN